MTANKIPPDFSKVLENSAKLALGECMRMPGLTSNDSAFEMDFVVRLHHRLVDSGISSESLMFQWRYDSLGPKHIDLIHQEEGREIAVEIEPIKCFWGSSLT